MATIGEAFVKIKADTAAFQSELKNGLSPALAGATASVGASMKQVGQSMTDVGKKLALTVTAPVVGLGVAVMKASGDFEQGMNKVRALTGATGTDFDKLKDQAKELGASTKFSATEAADAMGFLGMAGFDTTQILGAMPSVLQLAAAANLDLASSADITSNIMSGFGLTTEELAAANDTLVATLTSTNTDLVQLGDAFKYVGPVAKGAGVSFNETAAAIGLLGNAGIQGSMAGTSLRSAITRLLVPSGEAKKALERLGISAVDSAGNLLPLNQIIEQLETSGASTADMMTIFGQRAGPAMMALVSQGSQALRDLTTELDNSGGKAEEIANIQMEGFKGGIIELKSAIEGLFIAIGDAGLLGFMDRLARRLTEFVRSLTDVNPKILGLATAIAGIAAAAGPVLIILGSFAKALGSILMIVPTLAGAFGALISPVGLIVGGVALAAAAFGALMAVSPELREALGDLASAFGEIIGTIGRSLKPVFDIAVRVIKSMATTFGDLVATAVRDVMPAINGIVNTFTALNDAALPVITDVFDALLNALGNAKQGFADLIPFLEYNEQSAVKTGDAFMGLVTSLNPLVSGLKIAGTALEFLGFNTNNVVSDLQKMGFESRYTASGVEEMGTIAGLVSSKQSDLTNKSAALAQLLGGEFADGVDVATLGLEDMTVAVSGAEARVQEWAMSIMEANANAASSFWTFTEEAKNSIDTLIAELNTQTAAYMNWSGNITRLGQLLVQSNSENAEAIILEWITKGPAYAGALAGLVEGGVAKVGEYEAAFQMKGAAQGQQFIVGLATMFPGLYQLLGPELQALINENLTTGQTIALHRAQEIGKDVATGVRTGVDNNAGEVKTAVDTMVNNATSVDAGMARFRAEEIGKQIPGGVKAGIDSASGEVETTTVSALTKALTGATRYLQVRSPSGLFRDRVGKPMMTGVAQGVRDGASGAEAAVREVLTRIIGASQTAALQAFTAGSSAFRSSWQSSWSQVVSIAESAGSSMQRSFVSAASAMQNTTTSLMQVLRRGWDDYRQNADRVLRDVQQTFLQSTNQIQTTFLQMVNAITQAWQRLGQQLISTLTSAISDVRGRASSGGQEIGTALIDGTIRGIQNRQGGLANALVNAVRRAVDAAKAAARVSSPSKVTEEELGRPLMEGIIKGITDDGRLVQVALLSAVLDPMSDMRAESQNLIRITSRTGRQFVVQYTLARQAVDDTNNAIGNGQQAVEEFTGRAADSLEKWVEKMRAAAAAWATDFETVVDRMVGYATSQFDKLADSFSGSMGRAVDTISSGIDTISVRPVSSAPSSPAAGLPSAPSAPTGGPLGDRLAAAIARLTGGTGAPSDMDLPVSISLPRQDAAGNPVFGPAMLRPGDPGYSVSATRGPAVQITNATFVAPMDAEKVAQKVLIAERARALAS